MRDSGCGMILIREHYGEVDCEVLDYELSKS